MRIFLWLGALLLALLLLLSLSLALFWWWFDPEDYRAALGEELSALLGQPVTVEGRIDATVLPRPSVEIGTLRLQNPTGFEGPLFAEARGLRMDLDVPPLLGGRLRLAELELESLVLQLERNPDGDDNWEALVASVSFDRLGDTGMLRFEGLRAVRIGTVEIGWDDRREGRAGLLSLSAVELTGVQPGQRGELAADWHAGWNGDMRGAGALALGFQLDDRYLPTALAVHQADGRIMAKGRDEAVLSLRLEAELELELPARQFALSDLRLISQDLVADVQAEGRWANGGPEITGWLTVADDAFRDSLRRILRTEPDTEDPDALRRLRAQTMFSYGNRRLGLSDITLQLDDSLLEGNGSYSWQAVPLWEFDARLDYLPVDRYTPERFDPDAVRAVLIFLLERAEGRHVDGTLAVGKLESEGLQFTELTVRALSEGEVLEINPLEAEVYGGRYRGSLEVVLGSDPLHVRFLQRVEDMALGAPLDALFGWAVLDSQVDTQWEGAFSGLYWEQIRDSLEATGELRLRDGRINRFSLERLIEDAVPAGLGGAETEPFAEDASTAFSVISGSLQLSEGRLGNPGARARSEHFAVRGSGDLDLETARLDYRLELNILRTFETESERLVELLRGVAFPLRLHGPLTDLELDFDPQQLIEGGQEDEDREAEE